MTLRAPALLLALAASPAGFACNPAASSSSTDTSAGPSSSSSAPTEPTTAGTTDACDGSGDCDSEGICVAPYSPSDDPEHPGARGPAACVDLGACIGALDLERFCFDHQGCCESLRCRTVDGVCEPPELGQTGGETTGSDTTTSSTSTSTSTSSDDATTGDTTGDG